GRQNVIDHQQCDVDAKRARLENIWLQRPRLVAALVLGLCAVSATQFHKVRFDYDLRNMQSAGLPAVEFEKKLINAGADPASTNGGGKSVLFAAVVAESPTQALDLEKRIKALTNVVEDVDSVAGYLTEDQSKKLQLVSEIKQELSTIHFAAPDPRPVDLEELSRALFSLKGYLGLALEAVGTNEPALSKQLSSL